MPWWVWLTVAWVGVSCAVCVPVGRTILAGWVGPRDREELDVQPVEGPDLRAVA